MSLYGGEIFLSFMDKVTGPVSLVLFQSSDPIQNPCEISEINYVPNTSAQLGGLGALEIPVGSRYPTTRELNIQAAVKTKQSAAIKGAKGPYYSTCFIRSICQQQPLTNQLVTEGLLTIDSYSKPS